MKVRYGDGSSENLRANVMIMRQVNRWRKWRCHIGLESLRIKGDGRIFRAVCGVGGQIGRIGGEVTLPSAPVNCMRESCGCVADILNSRFIED